MKKSKARVMFQPSKKSNNSSTTPIDRIPEEPQQIQQLIPQVPFIASSNQNILGAQIPTQESNNHSTSTQQVNNINCNNLRAGDWVCLLCNNLNFSFRNECNRCFMQTKKTNFLQNMMLVQDTTPLPSGFQQNNSEQNLLSGDNAISTTTTTTTTQSPHTPLIESRIGDSFINEENPSEIMKPSMFAKHGGFENMLLLLTPNRSSMHSDDLDENRVSTTATTTATATAPSGHRNQSDIMKSSDPSNLLIETNQFSEDMFAHSMKSLGKEQVASDELNYLSSSPQNEKKSEIQDNQNDLKDQDSRGCFQLFGCSNTAYNFISSPATPNKRNNDDEDSEESDNGNFEQEIKQIYNIMMEEEEDIQPSTENKQSSNNNQFQSQQNQFSLSSYANSNANPSASAFSFACHFSNVSNTNNIKNNIPSTSIQQQIHENQERYSSFAFANSNPSDSHNSFSRPNEIRKGLTTANNENSNQAANNNSSGFSHPLVDSQQQPSTPSYFPQPKKGAAQLPKNQSIFFGDSSTFLSQKPHGKQNQDQGGFSIFSRLGDFDSFPLADEMNSQNTINFEQASSSFSKIRNDMINSSEPSKEPTSFAGICSFPKLSNQFEEEDDSASCDYPNQDNSESVKGAQGRQSAKKQIKKRKNQSLLSSEIKKKSKSTTLNNLNDINNNNHSNLVTPFTTESLHNYPSQLLYPAEVLQPSSFHHSLGIASTNSRNQVETNNSNNAFAQVFYQATNKNSNTNIITNTISNNNSNNNSNSIQNKNGIVSQQQTGQQIMSNNHQGASNPANVKKQDWICPRCNNLNYSFRKLCNKCQFAKNNFAIHIPPGFSSQMQQKQSIIQIE